MKVLLVDDGDGIMVSPETEFEEDFLSQMGQGKNLTCFVKTGLSLKDIEGIKIIRGSTTCSCNFGEDADKSKGWQYCPYCGRKR